MFDSGIIRDVISLSLFDRLNVKRRATGRTITISDGKEAVVVDGIHSIPITVGAVSTKVTCLVVHDSPFELIVARPSMKKIRSPRDFERYIATFRTDRGVSKVPLFTDGANEAGEVVINVPQMRSTRSMMWNGSKGMPTGRLMLLSMVTGA